MSAPDHFSVQQSDIYSHAGTLRDLADEIELAKDGASRVTLGRDAYGLVCQAIPSLLEPLHSAMVESLTSVVDALLDTSDRLRTAWEGYAATDDAAAGRLDGISRPQ
jgi:hypothetical protein